MASIKIKGNALSEFEYVKYNYKGTLYKITREYAELPDEVVVDILHKKPENFESKDINVDEKESKKESKQFDSMEGSIEAKKNIKNPPKYGTVAKPKKSSSKKKTRKKSK